MIGRWECLFLRIWLKSDFFPSYIFKTTSKLEVLDIFFCYKIGSVTFCLKKYFFLLYREFLSFEAADLVVPSPKSPLREQIPPRKPFSLTWLVTETYFKNREKGTTENRMQQLILAPDTLGA